MSDSKTDFDISRRGLLKGIAAAAGVVSLPGTLSGCGDDDPSVFPHGVASGDPLSDRVILWTRVPGKGGEDVDVDWEVATDASFANIVTSGTATATAAADHTVKVDATGLSAATPYFYRFKAKGKKSMVGATKTLPAAGASVSEVKMAVVSCANFPAGYFHVYDHIADEDVDVIVHLGDYIYEYELGGYATEDAEAMGRIPEPVHEILSLEDYRLRYAQYRADLSLQRAHAAHPMIVVWDDHEVANDAYVDGAENHDPATEGSYADRQAVALQAFHEWLPIRTGSNRLEINRAFDFGDLVALHMLDTRHVARHEAVDVDSYISGPMAADVDVDGMLMDAADPARRLLGDPQRTWLEDRVEASNATWQVLGQQVLMARMSFPAALALQLVDVATFTDMVARQMSDPMSLTMEEVALLSLPNVPYNFDAWDGFTVERELVHDIFTSRDKNLVVLAGDTHNGWGSNLDDDTDQPVGVELGTPSVSSPGLEEYLGLNGLTQINITRGFIMSLNSRMKYSNIHQRGWMSVTFTPTSTNAQWRYLADVKSADGTLDDTAARSATVMAGPSGRRVIMD